MAFCDLLRTTVLLAAGTATVLAAVTAIAIGGAGVTLTLFVALGWWASALAGPRGCGRRDRGARRRALIRRARLGAAAGHADPHAGPAPRSVDAGPSTAASSHGARLTARG